MESQKLIKPDSNGYIQVAHFDVFMGLEKGSPYIPALLKKMRTGAVMPLHHRTNNVDDVSTKHAVVEQAWIKGNIINFRIHCENARVNVLWIMKNNSLSFYRPPQSEDVKDAN